ncbi:MAG TPA: AAA family ATPase [Puia sp.]
MFHRDIITELKNWSSRDDRKPLVLRGARQVGKTTIVNTFAKDFQQYISLNLENPEDKVILEDIKDIHALVQSIFISRSKDFTQRQNTLIFIDEIQDVPGAFNMLRYFYESYPEIKVIAAGSLLETIFRRGLSFPVGRVEFMVIRPVSFPEYLGAMGENLVLEQLEQVPVNDFAHTRLMQLFHNYALIGGMPEIVARYAATKDLTALSRIYEQLITAYVDDVEKYGPTELLTQVIRHCIRASFREAGKRIKFERFAQSDYRSREVGEALRTLEKTFLLSLIYPSISAVLPITPDHRKSPRLQVLDTGMMNYFLGVQVEVLGTKDLNSVHQGTIIEHLVGQELLANQFNALSSLNFWVREKTTSAAEVDYIYPFEGQLIPIEVKSGKVGTLRSLHIFMDEVSHDMAIRFYSGKLQLTNVSTPAGKHFRLLSLPYSLASQTKKYIAWLKSQPPTSPAR